MTKEEQQIEFLKKYKLDKTPDELVKPYIKDENLLYNGVSMTEEEESTFLRGLHLPTVTHTFNGWTKIYHKKHIL